jgi:hypothetical protein
LVIPVLLTTSLMMSSLITVSPSRLKPKRRACGLARDSSALPRREQTS